MQGSYLHLRNEIAVAESTKMATKQLKAGTFSKTSRYLLILVLFVKQVVELNLVVTAKQHLPSMFKM